MSNVKYNKQNMIDDIILSLSGILSIIIVEFIIAQLQIFGYNIKENCIFYAICVIILSKSIYHFVRVVIRKFKNKNIRIGIML